MGIQGLLPALKSITEKKHLKQYEGQTAAVDLSVWIHQALFMASYVEGTELGSHRNMI